MLGFPSRSVLGKSGPIELCLSPQSRLGLSLPSLRNGENQTVRCGCDDTIMGIRGKAPARLDAFNVRGRSRGCVNLPPPQVAVVRMKQTEKVFALKILHKWEMLKRAEVCPPPVLSGCSSRAIGIETAPRGKLSFPFLSKWKPP